MAKRMPPFLDNCTSTFPRTMRHDGHAIWCYKASLSKRFFLWLVNWGWVIVFLGVIGWLMW